jgi:hypothetical protein
MLPLVSSMAIRNGWISLSKGDWLGLLVVEYLEVALPGSAQAATGVEHGRKQRHDLRADLERRLLRRRLLGARTAERTASPMPPFVMCPLYRNHGRAQNPGAARSSGSGDGRKERFKFSFASCIPQSAILQFHAATIADLPVG